MSTLILDRAQVDNRHGVIQNLDLHLYYSFVDNTHGELGNALTLHNTTIQGGVITGFVFVTDSALETSVLGSNREGASTFIGVELQNLVEIEHVAVFLDENTYQNGIENYNTMIVAGSLVGGAGTDPITNLGTLELGGGSVDHVVSEGVLTGSGRITGELILADFSGASIIRSHIGGTTPDTGYDQLKIQTLSVPGPLLNWSCA